jgi:hypothetical protein
MSIINYFNESEIMNQHRYGNGTDTNHNGQQQKTVYGGGYGSFMQITAKTNK